MVDEVTVLTVVDVRVVVDWVVTVKVFVNVLPVIVLVCTGPVLVSVVVPEAVLVIDTIRVVVIGDVFREQAELKTSGEKVVSGPGTEIEDDEGDAPGATCLPSNSNLPSW